MTPLFFAVGVNLVTAGILTAAGFATVMPFLKSAVPAVINGLLGVSLIAGSIITTYVLPVVSLIALRVAEFLVNTITNVLACLGLLMGAAMASLNALKRSCVEGDNVPEIIRPTTARLQTDVKSIESTLLKLINSELKLVVEAKVKQPAAKDDIELKRHRNHQDAQIRELTQYAKDDIKLRPGLFAKKSKESGLSDLGVSLLHLGEGNGFEAKLKT